MASVAAVSAFAAPVALAAATIGGSSFALSSAPVAHRPAEELVRTQDASAAIRFADGMAGVGVDLTTTFVEAEVAAIQGLTSPAISGIVAPTTTSTVAPTTTTAPPPPPTTVPPAPVTPAAVGAAYGDPADPATWDRLAQCESGGNWSINTGNGYYGGLQFSPSTWRSVGGTGLPHEHSRETQIEMGQRLQARAGWGQWPSCTKKLGYR